MACDPTASVDVGHVTTPSPPATTVTVVAEQSVTEGWGLPPEGVNTSLNVTLPPRATGPEGLGVTVAERVTDWFSGEGSIELVTAMDMLPGLTVWSGDSVPVL